MSRSLTTFGRNPNTIMASGFVKLDKKSVEKHINVSSGLELTIGVMDRKNQAITEPEKYIKDKKLIWDSIVKGFPPPGPGVIPALYLKLPGTAKNNRYLPTMSSLAREFVNIAKALIASGVEDQVAKEQADAQVKMILAQRIAQFSTAFPGLTDDAYDVGSAYKIQGQQLNAIKSGFKSPEKYKKYKAAYRATKNI